MSERSPKRAYVCRKRYLGWVINEIKATLELINRSKGWNESDDSVKRRAEKHALAIEAACWFPRSKLTPDEYKNVLTTKTKEVCQFLLKQNMVPNEFDIGALTPPQDQMQQRCMTPIPLIPHSAPSRNHITTDKPTTDTSDVESQLESTLPAPTQDLFNIQGDALLDEFNDFSFNF